MKKILVLGHTGMLGNAVYQYYFSQGYDVEHISNEIRWGMVEFSNTITNSDSEIIINCIGGIPQQKIPNEYFEILNVELPTFLESRGKKIIHPATDCEFSGKLQYPSKYLKTDKRDANDVYGGSKRKIAEIIENEFNNTKMIRTSIFGHEVQRHISLLDWFLNTDDNDTISGYSNYYWNGISTLQWCKEVEKIINEWDKTPKLTQVGSEGMAKGEFLKLIADIYNKPNNIIDIESNYMNTMLMSDYQLPSLRKQLLDLKEFYNK